ncbi:MAG: hypothetical protein KF856_00595 [Cyclobacteriaceae bacterium]|nr:hypothetical protein [Cyclobacteriaceae bacterium]
MKIKHLVSVIMLITVSVFTSCDLFEKADDVTFNVVLPLDFAIDEDNPEGDSYADSKLLNAASDPEIAKYADKIKEFKIDKVTYTISNANPASVTVGGTLSTSSNIIATATGVSLGNTAETDLNANTAGFNDLAAKLLDDKQEMILLTGTLSDTPVQFNVRFRFYVKITANAL